MENQFKSTARRIVIIGPESTGKTELSAALASYFHTLWIPEYARSYVEQLHRPYTLQDVLHIADKQVLLEDEFIRKAEEVLFLDTDLLITKVWLELVFNSCPNWIPKYLETLQTDLYLLCKPDIPWVPDPVRENGGEMRQLLYNRYRFEIECLRYEYREVYGMGTSRFELALAHVLEVFPELGQRTAENWHK